MESNIKYHEGGNKPCSACKQTKPLSEFERHYNVVRSDGTYGYRLMCKACKYDANKKYQKAHPHPETSNAQSRKWRATLHGKITLAKRNARYTGTELHITEKQYIEMVESQGGMCAICRESPIHAIDHDHQTGKFRGLLCGNCNKGIGLLRDNKSILQRAIDYLKRTEQ